MCVDAHSNRSDGPGGVSNSGSITSRSVPMQAQTIIGNSWKMRKVEIFRCNSCNYEYAFPRYGEILKIAETGTGRCSEWSMLFGAMLSSLGIITRIVHDFLDHCWNEAMLSPDGQWVHIDSTLDYPISLNHPYYYEENWGKEYKYVLAFSADNVEDVTQRYTLQWEAVQQRRLKNKV
jgi:peptide-N4-(N-acetyl-beta-glucosaminyl)asparagine amidase